MPEPNKPRPNQTRLETLHRTFVGKEGVLTCSGHAMIFRVEEILVTKKGWAAKLFSYSWNKTFQIGPFPWTDEGRFFVIGADFWALPNHGESYGFKPDMVAQYKAGLS